MKKDLLNIIPTSPVLSREELEQYVHNPQLSDKEKYAIELKINNNPINQELLEIYRQNPNALDSGCKSCFIKPLLIWSLGSLTVIGVFIVLWLMFFDETTTDTRLSTTNTKPFEKLKEAPKKASEAPKENHLKEVNSLTISPKQTIAYSTIAPITGKKANGIESEPPSMPELSLKKKYPAKYLGDFKVTDYGKIRKQDSYRTPDLPGTPAGQTVVLEQDVNLRAENDSLFYMGFLRETLRGFKHKKYQAILPAWKTILKQFPDDDNALFYGALTKFKLEQYEASVADLEQVLDNPMSNFNEEADWYLALNYYHLGQKQACCAILERIIKEATFYKEKAQLLIKQCQH